MDLVAMAQKLWHHKLLTVPVLVLTLLGIGYILVVKGPVYEASSSYVLINPPAPPTEGEVLQDPALSRINSDNPYARFSDPTVVADILATEVTSEPVKRALQRAGADPRYALASTSSLGYSSPIIDVSAQGDSPAVAIRSARLVGDQITRELTRVQRAKDVDPKYWIEAQQVGAPDHAELVVSGQLRMLIGVLAAGVILLFVVIALADALTIWRRDRVDSAPPSRPASDKSWAQSNGGADDGRVEGVAHAHGASNTPARQIEEGPADESGSGMRSRLGR